MLRRLSFTWRSLPKNLTHTEPGLQITGQKLSMSSTKEKLNVIHDTEASEFRIPLKTDGAVSHTAVLQYYEIKPGYVDLEHTIVPVEFRGHGIAKVLAQTAFDHFVEKKIDIRPTCTYLQKFYEENPLPQYKERVKWDASL